MNTQNDKLALEKCLARAVGACKDHGFGFVNVYKVQNNARGAGWDVFIYCPSYDVDSMIYQYVGLVYDNGATKWLHGYPVK